jgi:hypothetical protein
MCNPGFVAKNGVCVAETASTQFVCTGYEKLVLNNVSDQLTLPNGDDVPAQDVSGKGTCYYYPIVDLPSPITGSSYLTGTGVSSHDQDVVARDHDIDWNNDKVVWHPYTMNHTTLNMKLVGARTLQLTNGSLSGETFSTSPIDIDNFFLVGVYPKGTTLSTNNLLSFYSAWGTSDSTVANSAGVASNGVAFNPAGIALKTNETNSYPDGGTGNYSNSGVTTSSAYSIVPLNVEATGGTAQIPAVALTNLINAQVLTTVDFRALDCGSARYLGNIYLLVK